MFRASMAGVVGVVVVFFVAAVTVLSGLHCHREGVNGIQVSRMHKFRLNYEPLLNLDRHAGLD